jgi:multidrug resistance efflux pump
MNPIEARFIADDRGRSPQSQAPVAPGDALWRERVEAAFDQGEPIAAALRMTPPGAWMAVALLGAALLTATGFAVLGSVEVTARGPAALRAAGGTLPLLAEATGPVAWVSVRSGERVQAGQRLLGIDATQLAATLEESQRRLKFIESQSALSGDRLEGLGAERRRQLEARIEGLDQRLLNQSATIERFARRLKDMEELQAKGFVSSHARDDEADRLDEARRQRIALTEERARVRGEIAELQAQRETEHLRLREDHATALARRDAAQSMLRQTVATAPRAGVVEAVVVRQGELVQPGTVVARLVPDTAPGEVVAFISERDRAFLSPGAAARIEVRQLPSGEFGALHGRVTRIGGDLVGTAEWRDVMGDAAMPSSPLYRVEIAPEADARLDRLKPWLRAGMQADVRFTLRERRLITLILEPLRKWLA